MNAIGGSTRVISAAIVTAVVYAGRSLSQVAPSALREIASERDRAFVQACAFGVLRHYYALKARLATLMPKPLRRKDADLEALLLVGTCVAVGCVPQAVSSPNDNSRRGKTRMA